MKIYFTKEKYRLLLESVYIGERIINAQQISSEMDLESRKYKDLLGYIGSFAKDFGFKELVDQEGDGSFPSRKLEEKMIDYVWRYEEMYFRDELADRMASKELLEINGEEKIKSMSREEYFVLHDRLVDKRKEELEENGLKNLLYRK